MEYDEHRITIAHDIGCRFLNIDAPSLAAALNNGNTLGAEQDVERLQLDENKIASCLDAENITATSTTNLVETELCNNTTANITTTTTTNTTTTTTTSSSSINNHKNFQHHNGDDHGESASSQVTTTYNDGGGGNGEGDGGGRDSIVGGDTVDGDQKVKNYIDSSMVFPQLNGNSSNVIAATTNKTLLSSDELVLDILNDDLISRVRNKITSGSKELFEPCVKAVKAFLAGEPFREFEMSMYFHR